MRETRCRRAWARAFGMAAFEIAAVGMGVGCQPAEVKDCRDRYLVTHAEVANVDPQDLALVEAALGSVQSNLEICERANLAEETKQLTTAKRKLESHQTYLRARGSQKELTPEQLDALEKDGDAECPKGQAYQYQKSGRRIRCTGPQIISMNSPQAKAYFSGRGFKVTDTDNGLKAELGSESYTFQYPKGNDVAPADCVVVFSQPGIAWQETVARLTGAMPSRLKEGTPVRVGKIEVPFALQADPVQAILRFGTCAAEGAAEPSSVKAADEAAKPGDNQ